MDGPAGYSYAMVLARRCFILLAVWAWSSVLPSCVELGTAPNPSTTASAVGPLEQASRSLETRSDEGAPGDEALRRAASLGLGPLLQAIPSGREQDYGFVGADERSRLEARTVFRMAVLDETSGARGPMLLRELPEWRVLMTVDSEPRVLVTVARHRGTVAAVDLGAAGLARELDAASKGLSPPFRLLRMQSLGSDFLWTGQGSQARFLPLTSARRSLGLIGRPLDENELAALSGAALGRGHEQ